MMENNLDPVNSGSIAGQEFAVLYPVLLVVPQVRRDLKGREKVKYLSRHARRALRLSAQKTGAVLDRFPKDTDGVPLPVNGVYWSLSHKSDFVAAVVAGSPVGIDIEVIRSPSKGLFDRIARQREWELIDRVSTEAFFRFWTAKEAVLKATGVGFKGFSNCRIAGVADRTHLTVRFNNRYWRVRHCFFDDHLASIAVDGCDIQWSIDRTTHQG